MLPDQTANESVLFKFIAILPWWANGRVDVRSSKLGIIPTDGILTVPYMYVYSRFPSTGRTAVRRGVAGMVSFAFL